MTADNSVRHIPAGSCTWCGHPPHEAACPSTIRAAAKRVDPCPCIRHTWTGGRDALR